VQQQQNRKKIGNIKVRNIFIVIRMMDYIQNFAIKNKALADYGYDTNASNVPAL
jgi:hypothetical protein